MEYLYINNYRGFSDMLIPIVDVNFLVGENSTGKTSIMSIIYLLSDINFWLHQQFNTHEVQLGNFDEIVSHKKGGVCKSFEIGLFDLRDNSVTSATYFCFIEKDGIPKARKFYFYSEDLISQFIISSNTVKYKQGNHKVKKSEIISLCRKWKQEKEIGYKKLKEDKKLRHFRVFDLIRNIHNPKTDKYKPGTFFFPSVGDIYWIAPIRSKPLRTYDALRSNYEPSGEHTPFLIKNILEGNKKYKSHFLKILNNFGKESSLFDSISVKRYGSSRFSLDINIDNKILNIKNVGYGVSQCLPVITEILVNAGDGFAIQQPEVHLHPKAQSALGDIVYSFANNQKTKFLIETHSDFTINRYRKNCSLKTKINSQVLFFERTKNGNKVAPIEIMKNGQYKRSRALAKYRNFFIKEDIELLEY